MQKKTPLHLKCFGTASMTGTKIYINLQKPWIFSLSWFRDGREISSCSEEAKACFYNEYEKWLKRICEDDWSYDTEFDYSRRDKVELKPFIVFRSSIDAIRFKLEWSEG